MPPMDLGIAGRWGIVCASSQGLAAHAPKRSPKKASTSSSTAATTEKLEKTATDLRDLPGISREVIAVAADITTELRPGGASGGLPRPRHPRPNNRGPKPGVLADQTVESFEEALTLHFRTPLALFMEVLPGMKERGWGGSCASRRRWSPHPRRCRSRAPAHGRRRRR